MTPHFMNAMHHVIGLDTRFLRRAAIGIDVPLRHTPPALENAHRRAGVVVRLGTKLAMRLAEVPKVDASRDRGMIERPCRILLAEDDPEMRVLLAVTLEGDGFEVVQVGDGARLLHQIGNASRQADKRSTFDLIISDVRMPKLSGMEVLGVLAYLKVFTPFIIITAFGDEALHAEAQRLGAAAVLDKPFDIDDLRAEIHRLLPPNVR